MDSVRIDKWLWAVRIYKTRSIAAEACKKSQVTIDGNSVKPSRVIKVGDVIHVKRPPITRSFKVLALSEKRMGAKLVPDFMKDVTSQKELDFLEMKSKMSWFDRDRGTGRPTKKDRRDIEKLNEDWWEDSED